ncbi:hypothetical protein AKI39_16245 [Bordetella sp. H567]|uniref:hypothetical protein n=1 Tax=Bordetella sp. H567 TaxID=1697043 RepID=UPI00081C4204|nr:hypothetical protein [Bordetella sp. H567]AOB31922.1 hypothetical protein AKI39_16245 [Bordetella sp. H567]
MSDTVLNAEAFRPRRGWSGGLPWFRRLRLKQLGDGMVDYVAEVFAEMERGRHLRPVISAYKPQRW